LSRDYTKKGVEQLDYIIGRRQADSKYIKLLRILSEQLERFIIKGRLDIHSFYKMTMTKGLLLEHEHEEIVSQFPLEIVRLNYMKQVKRLISV
jgi:hypothetical protein